MELNGRIFSIPARFNTAIEAKAELAAQGYKFIAGIDWGQSLHPVHSPGANTTVLAGQKQVFESFEQKLSNLALSYRIGSVLHYGIRPHGSRGGFIGDLNVDGSTFQDLLPRSDCSACKGERCRESPQLLSGRDQSACDGSYSRVRNSVTSWDCRHLVPPGYTLPVLQRSRSMYVITKGK
jgi:hypothetical protein